MQDIIDDEWLLRCWILAKDTPKERVIKARPWLVTQDAKYTAKLYIHAMMYSMDVRTFNTRWTSIYGR